MNKAIRLSAMAAACAFFAFLSATEVRADGFLITSDHDLMITDSGITSEDILLTDGPGYSSYASDVSGSTVLTGGTGNLSNDDILYSDHVPSDYGEDILAGSPDLPTNNTGSTAAVLNNEDLLIDTVGSSEGNILTGGSTRVITNSDNNSRSGRVYIRNNSGSDSNVNTGSTATAGKTAVSSKNRSSSGSSSSSSRTKTKTKNASSNTSINNKKNNTSKDTGSAAVTDAMKTMLNAINKKRAEAGVSQLTFSSQLNRIASLRVKEASSYFSHNRANGKNWVSILDENGVAHEIAGENLACRISNPEQVVRAWSMSPSHNRCMLNGDYNHAGIGTITVNGCTYWTLTLTD